MIYFIHGEDNFRSSEYLNDLIVFYQKQKPFYFSYDFDDNTQETLDNQEIKDLITSRNLFTSIKLIIFKNLLIRGSEKNIQELLATLNQANTNTNKSILLIFYEREEIKNKNVLHWFERETRHIKKFDFFNAKELSHWIDEQAQHFNVQLTKESKEMLAGSFGSDTGMIYYALKKLSLLSSNIIDVRVLEENVWLPLNTNVFRFLDNLAQRNITTAIKLLMQEIKKDDSLRNMLYLLSMINFEFRSLLMVKENQNRPQFEIRRKTSLNPYVLSKIYPLAKKFTLSELKNIYHQLLVCDERIKRGLMPAEVALPMLVLDIKQILMQ